MALIQQTISLQDKNWFNTGGPARYYIAPTSALEFQKALLFASQEQIPICMLGQGANILISDEGFNGLVIHPHLKAIKIYDLDTTHSLVYAQAGVDFQELISWCLKHQLLGLEEFSGIPGTVGGSVFINIHYFEFLLSQFIMSAEVIHKKTGILETVDNTWFNFSYNYSTLHTGEYYLISATFKLKKASALETAYAIGRREEIARHRAQRYPKAHTCGSFFRNFYEHEVNLFSQGKKLIYVAYYLDKIGVKGHLAIGGAQVSYQHANMIINKHNATTQDIILLARKMQELVYNHFGILPQAECRLIGFKTYPLLTFESITSSFS